MIRCALALVFVGLPGTLTDVVAETVDDRPVVEIRVGIQGVERMAVVFPDAATIPQTFLTSLAPDGKIALDVDGRARTGSVSAIQEVLARRGLTYISISSPPEVGARVRVREDGRVEVSFAPTQLHMGIDSVDRFLAEFVGASVVELRVDDKTPARIVMGLSNALKELGAEEIRVR